MVNKVILCSILVTYLLKWITEIDNKKHGINYCSFFTSIKLSKNHLLTNKRRLWQFILEENSDISVEICIDWNLSKTMPFLACLQECNYSDVCESHIWIVMLGITVQKCLNKKGFLPENIMYSENKYQSIVWYIRNYNIYLLITP